MITPDSDPPKYIFQCHQPKADYVHFNDTCEFINSRDTKNETTPLVNANDDHLTEEPEVEEEDYFYYSY